MWSWRKEAPQTWSTDKELYRRLLLPLWILLDKEHTLFFHSLHPHHPEPTQPKTITKPGEQEGHIPMVKGDPMKK